MGMSKEMIARVKESIKVGSFSKAWWKQLSKVVKESKLSNFEKIMVFTKIAYGLYEESIKLAEKDIDLNNDILNALCDISTLVGKSRGICNE